MITAAVSSPTAPSKAAKSPKGTRVIPGVSGR